MSPSRTHSLPGKPLPSLVSREDAAVSANAAAEDLSDAAIVERVLAGHREEFEVLVYRYEQRIYRHIHRIVRQTEDAEDLTQETFVRAFTRLETYSAQRPFRPWLYRIATNAAIGALRKQRPTQSLDEDGTEWIREPKSPGPGVAEIVDARLRIEKLGAALDHLSATARAVFHMRYGNDMSLEEIGEAMGKKPGAVAVLLHRARLRLYGLVYGNDASPTKEITP